MYNKICRQSCAKCKIPPQQVASGEKLETIPKLLVYGTKDEFTPVNEVEELYKIIPEPKMIKLVNSTHDYRYYPEAIKETEETIDQFLTKYFL